MNLQTQAKRGQFRPTFESTYAIPQNASNNRTKGHRLGKLMVCVYPIGHPDFLLPAEDKAFAVIDAFTRRKAFFDWPKNEEKNPDVITAMIESHFDSPAMRIESNLWMV